MISFGNVPAASVLPIFFDSFKGSDGSAITITGLAVTDIEIYKGTSMTQRSSDNGYALIDTDGIDLDGTTGIHGFSVDLGDNSDAGFFAAGSFYNVVVASVTIDGVTVNFLAATFRIVAAEGTAGTPVADATRWNNLATVALPLVPTTAGRTLDVTATGEAGIDWANIGGPTTAVDLSGTNIKTDQKVDVNTIKTNPVVNGGTITFPTTATLASTTNITAATGVDITKILGTAISTPATAGVLDVNLKNIANVAVSTTTAQLGVNVVQISTDGTAADNLEAMLDGTGGVTLTTSITGNMTGNINGNLTGSVGSVTGAVGSVTGAVGSVTGNVGGNVVGSVASVTGAVGSVTGNVGGNVVGSVASVTGAVGSVTGAVGSVTGNVGGNVTGSVGSVVGAVGSVTGNVGGNVTGSVGSVVGAVGSVTGAVGSVTGAVGSVTGNVGGNVTGSVGSLAAQAKIDVTTAASNRVQKNTALAGFMFLMTDSTLHAPATGLSITATRSLDGAAFGACTNAASEVSAGVYKIDLASGDLNGNTVMLKFTAALADARYILIETQPT